MKNNNVKGWISTIKNLKIIIIWIKYPLMQFKLQINILGLIELLKLKKYTLKMLIKNKILIILTNC